MLNKIKSYFPIIMMLCVAAAVGILLLTGTLNVDEILNAVRDNKPLAVLVIMGLYVIKGCSIMFPVGAILIGTSVVFDIYSAIVIGLLGNALCVSISYFIGRRSKELTFDGLLSKHPKLKKYFVNAKEYSFTFCFVVHTSHLSMEAQGILFGLLRTPYLAYLSSTMLALLPSTMCYTVIGNSFDLKDPRLWLFLGMDAVMVIAGLIYAKRNIIDGGKKNADS